MSDQFRKFAHWISNACGSAYAFSMACLVIVAWLISGRLLDSQIHGN
jgi:low affinity Fe/Cu permease